ncbi:MAG: 1-deoxy-D-xylulose-5-phosphate synthase [Actinomyces sp.]|jgi:1-deoxy-D-xylulose-5-phosphate synthase|nr:1-deoxy-D-xylulose-5-phosphate synthase [Actinomyces sp.]MCI1641050.1 1-deoxy-D-xylulose-5-phosphate synthase [Actinomyces sp.]MCI1661418.1 1-deoxy-D-xylulose-5-phosphate synthase [Actinomyces sp.]MCI1690426.1 1-deoxy-D-xylulose-5-phosphate synthase [Actinomyces sp.]MCI1787067.1 1-deoxy-D-xylulose-5-phosphate synthase [Actinomyces sp.]MCI1829367.1 1-deoxy-D-xylulose-5-phosphate synthase [Actinomyces sp.]
MVLPDNADELPLLSRVHRPSDLQRFTPAELVDLAQEIRRYLIASVSRTGGHLGPNLGVVELTIALHRVFDSPRDSLVFDTGHQTYVHKLLTGRQNFSRLRQRGGLSGYASRAESPHDVVENSHASASLAWADGISREKRRRGDPSWTVAVIGDGALTGGMAWEALNSIAAEEDSRLVVVVNDNGRSYAPTVGGLAHHLDALRTSQQYERTLAWGKRTLLSLGDPGRAAYDALHGLKTGLKDVLAPQAMFEDLGLKYLGPVDGHDEVALETALGRARAVRGPVLVHAITEKGRGYTPAEEDLADRFHAVGRIHPETGLPVEPQRFGWTSVFADEIVRIARRRDDVVGLTAAMMQPVGLGPMAAEFPDRVIDVGIAEQLAVTSAAGMAFKGAHPVVAVYATFLNRAFDQVLMDVGLHRAGVTFALDRAGITGDDGPSHNGMWDISMLQVVPGLRLAAPRDEATLREELNEAVEVPDAPTAVRYPKGPLPRPLPALRRVGAVDVLAEPGGEADGAPAPSARVLLVAAGSLVPEALEAADALAAERVAVTVVDPRWIVPVPRDVVDLARKGADLVVTVEDGVLEGGFGWAVRDALSESGVPVQTLGIPRRYLEQGRRSALQAELGLDAVGIAASVGSRLARMGRVAPVPSAADLAE